MKKVRYSPAFKMRAVREVENGQSSAQGLARKYDIKGHDTVMRWRRQFGRGQHGTILRVETPEEIDEAARLRSQRRRAKEALADAHMELALEQAFLVVACEQRDQSVESFKKSTLAGPPPSGPNAAGIERAPAVRVGPDDAPKRLRAPPRLGGRKRYHRIAPELQAAGVKLGRDRLVVALGKVGGLVARKPAEWPKTTHFDPNLPGFKNRIRQHLETGPNPVWGADITSIRPREDFMYLGLITDRWSRKIVGYHLGETLATEPVLKALAMAVKGLAGARRPIPPLGLRLPGCVARLCGGRAAGRPDPEYDRAEPQRGECPGRARQRDSETGVLAGCPF